MEVAGEGLVGVLEEEDMRFKIGTFHGRCAGHTSEDGFVTVMIITTFPLVERPCARCPTQDPPDHNIAFSFSLFELNIK